VGAVLQQRRQLLSRPEVEAAVVRRLRGAGCVFAVDVAALLLAGAFSAADLESRLRRRETGEPLEVILGWADFCGLRVAVDPGVFVPRQRTTLLVDLAAELLPADRPAVVLDLCCGTGALGIALAARADIELVAAELDPRAVACARRNLAGIGEVFESDLFAALPDRLRGQVDIVLANAPYVPTDDIALMPPEARLHEPRVALDGGEDGLTIHRRIAAQAPDWLAPGGRLLIEVADRQVARAVEAMGAAGLVAQVCRDEERGAIAVVGLRVRRGKTAPSTT
jgi:release factor glutamine methyltransferase